MTGLEAMRRDLERLEHLPNWRKTIGARIARLEHGLAELELEVGPGHRHEGGVVQGGIITQLADAAMGIALRTVQPADRTNTTIELKINFIRPAVEGLIRATGRPVALRAEVLFAEAEVVNSEGKLVARATSTCLVLPARRGDLR